MPFGALKPLYHSRFTDLRLNCQYHANKLRPLRLLNVCPQQSDLRLSGPPSGQGASGGARGELASHCATEASEVLERPLDRKRKRAWKRSEREREEKREVASESALRSGGTLLSRVQAPPPVPRPGGGPESLRSPCCGLAIYKNQPTKIKMWITQTHIFSFYRIVSGQMFTSSVHARSSCSIRNVLGGVHILALFS
ncbi:hypothetical protein PoB_002330500 [Plakobranchus ocellatus]|uniref:Uncharacterized protein n=1 Tax=Plakobranchus ocellatus TaxID=259542 RepID=A0AAV3ZM99_9GAST|nr:hypothetical protein PoB_002330500 [Plakobranchus ocellatus]